MDVILALNYRLSWFLEDVKSRFSKQYIILHAVNIVLFSKIYILLEKQVALADTLFINHFFAHRYLLPFLFMAKE